MFPQPTELRLIGCSTESMWTTKIQIKYIDTKNQLADILTKGNITRYSWNHLFCLTLIISVLQSVQKGCRKEHKKDTGEEWVTSKSKPMMNLISRSNERLRQRCLLLHQKVRWKSETKVRVLWVRKLISTMEQGDPLFAVTRVTSLTDPLKTHTHHATQNGILRKFGFVKSVNLMNWWMIERGDLCLPSRRSARVSDTFSREHKNVIFEE